MSNPFPGVDPFVEAQKLWSDFHTSFLTYARDAITERLPAGYLVRIEERFKITTVRGESEIRPDVAVDRKRSGFSTRSGSSRVATAAFVTLPLPVLFADKIVERRLEIRRRKERTLVAVIELLSPTNKLGQGRLDYLLKRRLLINKSVHLIELDFLLGGKRLPMGEPLPKADFYAFVSRSDCRPDSDVFAWSIRNPLPTIPLPLDSPDPDLPFDLAGIYDTTYRRGRYDLEIVRDRPLKLPVADDDKEWLASRLALPGTKE